MKILTKIIEWIKTHKIVAIGSVVGYVTVVGVTALIVVTTNLFSQTNETIPIKIIEENSERMEEQREENTDKVVQKETNENVDEEEEKREETQVESEKQTEREECTTKQQIEATTEVADKKTVALKLAKELCNEYEGSAMIRYYLYEYLYCYGSENFSEEEIEYAIENCGVNWKEEALEWANENCYDEYMTPNRLRENLLYGGEFKSNEIEYAIENFKIDWKESAIYNLWTTYDEGLYTKAGIIAYLVDECGFTNEQATYAIENGDIDWFSYAEMFMDNYVVNNKVWISYCSEHGCFKGEGRCQKCGNYGQWINEYITLTNAECVAMLVSNEFSEIEAEYAASMYEYQLLDDEETERYHMAYFTLECFLSDMIGGTRDECSEQLRNWGFTEEEILYAQSQFEDYYFWGEEEIY